MIILLNFAGPGFAEPEVTYQDKSQEVNRQKELAGHLEKLIEQLRQERSDFYTQKARYDTQIQKARENHSILKDELDQLRLQETESDKQIQKYKEEIEDIKKQLVSKTDMESVLRKQVQPFRANQKIIIKDGIPYKQNERLARLDAAYGGSDVNEPNGISTANQLENIWNYSLEELRIGRSSETYTDRAKTSNNALPYARYFRVGHIILGYITEDGRQTAMWLSLPNQNGFSVIKDKKQSEQIRNAVEILDHHQPPELVMLPISLMSAKAEEDDSNAEH